MKRPLLLRPILRASCRMRFHAALEVSRRSVRSPAFRRLGDVTTPDRLKAGLRTGTARGGAGRRGVRQRGAALLEVLIALALFVAAAAVVTGALNSSMQSLERQRLGTHALNLAASVMAELQLGIRVPGGEGRRPFDAPFQDWSWELALTPTETEAGEATGLTRVEVIVRHETPLLVQRLTQVLKLGRGATTNILTASREP